MRFNLNIEKRYVLLIVGLLLINAVVFSVFAYRSGGPPSYFGHSAEELEVNASGEIITLQQFIDNSTLGNGGANCQWKRATSTKIADIANDGITGFCKFNQNGKNYFGNVDAIYTLNGVYHESPLAYCGSDYNPGNVNFDYYVCK